MITVRPSEERGRGKFDWLDSYFSFSFSQYYDPAHMNFSNLQIWERVRGSHTLPEINRIS